MTHPEEPTSFQNDATDEQSSQSASVTRWVAPVKNEIPRTKHGLLDSATLSRDWYAGDRPQLAEDLIGTRNSYVLLAPGGAGKTTLVKHLMRYAPDSVSINLRLQDTRSLTERLKALIKTALSEGATGVTVFVDAIDEALQVNPNIGYVLADLLSRPGSDHIAWRFSCRPASWTVGLADGMQSALPGFEELELLPLSLAEIQELAGTDADRFVTAVDDARLTRLLAHPLHARNLLDQWRASGHQLPTSRSEAMQHAVTSMLTETSSTRLLAQLDDRRRLLIAERLAATSLFCGVGTFALGPVTPRHTGASTRPAADENAEAPVLAVTSVPTQTEPDLSGFPVAVEDILEVLGTALFAAAGRGTVAFVHQSYAEFLAAAYLARRRVAGRRLVSVLGADVNGLVPGPMIEVLGWLLALGAPVSDALIADNAKQLLSTAGLELVGDQVRADVVAALLRGAAAGTIDEGWRTDTSILSHPGLAAQLGDAAARASNPWVVFWICRIARQCAVFEVSDDLLEIALESAWPDFIRAEAVKAFAEVAPRDRITELETLLHLSAEEDPQDEILAATLRAMLPDGIAFDQYRNTLRPRRTPKYLGNYFRLLGELHSLIPDDDVLPALIDALRHRPQRDDRVFDHLIGGLLERAWRMGEPAIAAEIGAELGSQLLSARDIFSSKRPPWQSDDAPDIRRAMAATALTSHPHAHYSVLEMRMLTTSDLRWLLDWMRTAPSEALEPARVVLGILAWDVADAERAELLLDIQEDHPAHDVVVGFQGHREISSRAHGETIETENDAGSSATELEARLRDTLARAGEDVNDWWKVAIALAGDSTRIDIDILLSWDLTSKPMWPTITDEEQDELLRLGLDYLQIRRPDPSRWLGRDTYSYDDVMPDWTAVFLLATLAAHRPDLLTDVESTTWASWARTIIAMPPGQDYERGQRQIRNAAPQPGRDAIDEALRERVQQATCTRFAHHPLADFTDNRLIPVIERVARNAQESETRRNEALAVLVEHAPDIALNVARTALHDDVVPPAAFAVIVKLAPEELVKEWITQGRIGAVEHLRALDPGRLSGDTLATLTGMLLDELPFTENPEQRDDFAERTPEAMGRRLRTRLLTSMASRGMASDLIALAQGRAAADLDQIRYLLQEARAREAQENWRPLQPDTLMELLASGDARLVRDNAGLLAVLLEQLEQIQNDIHGRASFRSLWNGEPGAKGASPKGEDTISDWLVDQLRLRLQPHVVVDREIQVTRRKAGGVGTRIDITATSGGRDIRRVIFEAKLVNNPELLTAIDKQLVGQYMEPATLTHGIYIVYWTAPELRQPKKHPDANVLAEELRKQAQNHLPNKYIKVVVLDIGPPA